jgi:hypothetical protein
MTYNQLFPETALFRAPAYGRVSLFLALAPLDDHCLEDFMDVSLALKAAGIVGEDCRSLLRRTDSGIFVLERDRTRIGDIQAWFTTATIRTEQSEVVTSCLLVTVDSLKHGTKPSLFIPSSSPATPATI